MGEVWLTVREGADAGREWPVGEGLVIGRSASADVVLADPTISRRHASVVAQGETAVVEDLGSSNGTFVNGDRVEQPSRASEGDKIHLGDSVLEVRIGPTGQHTSTGEPTVLHPRPAAKPEPGQTVS